MQLNVFRLKVLRVMANLSQSDAAAKVGVSQSVISDWESGKYKPSPTAIAKLAEAYKTTEAVIVQSVVETMEKNKEAPE